jgi:hypothetical protein
MSLPFSCMRRLWARHSLTVDMQRLHSGNGTHRFTYAGASAKSPEQALRHFVHNRRVSADAVWPDTSCPPMELIQTERRTRIGDLYIDHRIMLLPLDQQSRECRSMVLSRTAIIEARSNEEEYLGFLHYDLLRAPWSDGSGDVLAVHIRDVAAFTAGKGVASALYTELRDANRKFVVGASHYLTDLGRAVATHYRATYPDIHVGRFDKSLVLHRTAGADDPAYLPTHFGWPKE